MYVRGVGAISMAWNNYNIPKLSWLFPHSLRLKKYSSTNMCEKDNIVMSQEFLINLHVL